VSRREASQAEAAQGIAFIADRVAYCNGCGVETNCQVKHRTGSIHWACNRTCSDKVRSIPMTHPRNQGFAFKTCWERKEFDEFVIMKEAERKRELANGAG